MAKKTNTGESELDLDTLERILPRKMFLQYATSPTPAVAKQIREEIARLQDSAAQQEVVNVLEAEDPVAVATMYGELGMPERALKEKIGRDLTEVEEEAFGDAAALLLLQTRALQRARAFTNRDRVQPWMEQLR